ncbi:hypothetical protein YPPY04_1217, partial [Yersinia pestis PY-04]
MDHFPIFPILHNSQPELRLLLMSVQ